RQSGARKRHEKVKDKAPPSNAAGKVEQVNSDPHRLRVVTVCFRLFQFETKALSQNAQRGKVLAVFLPERGFVLERYTAVGNESTACCCKIRGIGRKVRLHFESRRVV